MIELLFVDDFPDDGTRSQMSRSHAARIEYQQRQKKARHRHDSQAILASGKANHPYLLSTREPQDLPVVEPGPAPMTIVLQPRCPLALGPEAAPAASLNGHRCIDFFIARAASKCSYIYPAFNMSSIHSLDWAEIIANRLMYHAAAAFLQALDDGPNMPSKMTLIHRGKAIAAVRGHLYLANEQRCDIDLHVIMAIVFLALLDERLGITSSHALHRNMIGVLMEMKRDSWSLEYEPICSVIIENELGWALQTGYSVISYHPTKRRRTKMIKHDALTDPWMLAALPPGFQALVTAGMLSHDVAETVAHVAETMQGKRSEIRLQNASRRFNHSCEVFPYLHPDYSEALTLEDLLELAILQFCSYAVAPKDHSMAAHFHSRTRLAENLPIYVSRRPDLSQVEAETLLWMWVLTLYAWEEPQKDAQFDRATTNLQNLPFELTAVVLNEDELEGLLRRHFWTKDFIAFGRSRWKSLCNSSINPTQRDSQEQPHDLEGCSSM